jgi:hypothetical protein
METAMIAAAFAALGFLIGNLTGLSASPIAQILVPALFALIGGSFIAFLSTVPHDDRRVAAGAIMGFSLACLVGTYVGILVNVSQVLGSQSANLESYSYLRTDSMGQVEAIDARKRNGEINVEKAYDELITLLRKKP